MRILALIAAALLTGCATYSPAVNEAPAGKFTVYRMPVDKAQQVVASTMRSHFDGREIEQLPPPAVGYSTHTRMLLDTWTTTVTILPVRAKVATEDVDAVKIDVRGSGSSVLTGRAIYEGFKDRLAATLAGSAVAADSVAVR